MTKLKFKSDIFKSIFHDFLYKYFSFIYIYIYIYICLKIYQVKKIQI